MPVDLMTFHVEVASRPYTASDAAYGRAHRGEPREHRSPYADVFFRPGQPLRTADSFSPFGIPLGRLELGVDAKVGDNMVTSNLYR